MAQTSYRRLPGKGRRGDGGLVSSNYTTSRLWLAADHLLLVDQIYCDQSVRRFYLKDIQCISVRKTARFAITNGIFGLLLVIGAMPAFYGDELGWQIFGYGLGSIALLLLLVNLVLGPTSKAFIQTAVHRIELPSFNRLRNATKALSIIVPAIEAVQGKLDLSTLDETTIGPASPTRASLDPARTAATRGNRATDDSMATDKWHRVLYPLLAIEGLTSLITILYNNLYTVGIGTGIFLIAGMLAVMAFARQNTPRVSNRLRTLTKTTIGYFVFALVVGWVEFIAMMIQDPTIAANQHLIFVRMAELDPLEVPWLLLHLLGFGTASLLFGIIGMLWCRDLKHITRSQIEIPNLPPPLPATAGETDLFDDAIKISPQPPTPTDPAPRDG